MVEISQRMSMTSRAAARFSVMEDIVVVVFLVGGWGYTWSDVIEV